MIQGDALLDASAMFAPHELQDRGDIYRYYARFRDQGRIARAWPSWLGGDDTVVLLTMQDVSRFLRDQRLVKEWRTLLPPGPEPAMPASNTFGDIAHHFMLFRDPPDHTRLRTTSNMAFTPRHVNRMREPIKRLAERLLSGLREQVGPADLIAGYAYPLPVLVIAGILGVPDEDYPRFRDWAAVVAAAIDLPASGLEDFASRANATTAELVEYFTWIIGQRRKEPQDDLISSLMAAESSEGKINEKELTSTLILLLVAGHETTVNLIGNGTLALLQHPDQWRALVEDPSLAKNATDELLRYDSPVQMTTRFASEEMEVGGVPVRRGTEVFFVLGSANRDPAAFEMPDRLDIRRDVGRIMSFGMGIHFCLGAPLARLEGEIAFRTLAEKAPELALASDRPDWRAGVVLRGLRELPVMLSSATS